MFGARTVGSLFETGKAKDEADELVFFEGTQDQPSVMDDGDEHVARDDVCFRTGPDLALKFFDEFHFIGRFK
jgi:hypothetical protein